MKDKDDIFDGFMDEKTIEMISEDFPVLTDDEKDRIFASIERKLDIKSEKTFLTSDDVEGVERYHRSQIVRIAGLAAALTIIVSGLGGGSYLLHNLNKNAPPGPDPEITQAVTGTSKYTTTSALNYTTTIANASTVGGMTNTSAASLSVTTSAVSGTNDDAAKTRESETTDITENEAEDNAGTETVPTRTEPPAPTTTATTEPPAKEEPGLVPPTKAEAEELLLAFQKISDITFNRIAGSNADITLKHGYSDGSGYIGEEEFSKIDPSLYSSMDELRSFYNSVMINNGREDHIFGPEINVDDPDGMIFDQSAVDHAYITFNGELYGKTQSYTPYEFGPYGTVPPRITAADKDGMFRIIKTFATKDQTTNATSITLYVIKNEDTGRWLIDSYDYNYS